MDRSAFGYIDRRFRCKLVAFCKEQCLYDGRGIFADGCKRSACAMQNIYLSCEALGLGCVWINQLKDCFDEPEVRSILDEFGVPKNHGVYGSAAIGYKTQEAPSKEIKGTYKIVK